MKRIMLFDVFCLLLKHLRSRDWLFIAVLLRTSISIVAMPAEHSQFVEFEPGIFVEKQALRFVDRLHMPADYSEEQVWKMSRSPGFGWALEILSSKEVETKVSIRETVRIRALAVTLLADYFDATDGFCKFLYGAGLESVVQDEHEQIALVLKKLEAAFRCKIHPLDHGKTHMNELPRFELAHGDTDNAFRVAFSLSKAWIGPNRFLYFPDDIEFHDGFSPQKCDKNDGSFILPDCKVDFGSIVSESSFTVLDCSYRSYITQKWSVTNFYDMRAVVGLNHSDFAVGYCLNYPIDNAQEIGTMKVELADELALFRHTVGSFCKLVYGCETGSLDQNDCFQLATLERFDRSNEWYSDMETVAELKVSPDDPTSAVLSIFDCLYLEEGPKTKRNLLSTIELSRRQLDATRFMWSIKHRKRVTGYFR